MIIKIGNKKVGDSQPVFIIAEAGINYNNNLKLAFKMVDKAVMAKADAIKFQTFITEDIQLRNSIKPKYQKKIKTKTYFEILKENEPLFAHHKKIADYCKKRKIIFLSTTADKKSTDFLEKISPAYKIGALDLSNHILLEYVAKKRKPIILSTGISTIELVSSTINLIKKYKMKNNLILLQTNSDYPSPNEDVNLRVIPEYRKKFNVLVGLSDHTEDHTACLGAVALGACVLEKHFTLNKNLPGVDQKISLEPQEFKELVEKVRLMEKSLGSKKKEITKSEKENLSMRKKITIKPAKKGEMINFDLIDAKRGNKKGILPIQKNIKKILGKKLKTNILKEQQFSWNMI